MQRAQRLLDVPASERTSLIEAGADTSFILVPGDYLKLISLSVEGHELSRADMTTVVGAARVHGQSRYFHRDANRFLIGPKPYEGQTIKLVYDANFAAVSDNEANWLTDIAPDMLVSGAMVEACRFFVDPRMQSYEDAFVKAIGDLNMQAAADELTHGAMPVVYSFDFGRY